MLADIPLHSWAMISQGFRPLLPLPQLKGKPEAACDWGKAGKGRKARAKVKSERIKGARRFPDPIADSRIAWARALRALRNGAVALRDTARPIEGRALARGLRGVEKTAWQVALSKARFLADGSCGLYANGKRVPKSAKADEAIARDGTGRAVDWKTVIEMHAAARAQLVMARRSKRHAKTAGADGVKGANKAANRELHHTARESVFSTAAEAEAAQARACALRHAKATDENDAPAQPQPHASEFLDQGEATDPRAIVKGATQRAMRALRAYYGAKTYGRKRNDYAADMRAIRNHARTITSGEAVRGKWRDDQRASERANALGKRVETGMALLSAQAPARVAPILDWTESVAEYRARAGSVTKGESERLRAGQVARAVVTLPIGRAEVCARHLAIGYGQGARLLARAGATRGELETLRAHFARAGA